MKNRSLRLRKVNKAVDSPGATVISDQESIVVVTPSPGSYGKAESRIVREAIQDTLEYHLKCGAAKQITDFEQKTAEAKPGAYALQLLREAKRLNIWAYSTYRKNPEKMTSDQIEKLELYVTERRAQIANKANSKAR